MTFTLNVLTTKIVLKIIMYNADYFLLARRGHNKTRTV